MKKDGPPAHKHRIPRGTAKMKEGTTEFTLELDNLIGVAARAAQLLQSAMKKHNPWAAYATEDLRLQKLKAQFIETYDPSRQPK